MSELKRKSKEFSEETGGSGSTIEDKAERRWQSAAEYRQRPEVRERQRVLMAERRAAVKARRHQWDPPKNMTPKKLKKTMSVMHHETQIPLISPPVPPPDIASLTDTEHFAIGVLIDMAMMLWSSQSP
ncbi:hypothetical protein B0H13DRAFT_2313632 [Mycena leptocephala]|nr:hypothetical protein B0H13DRAFT_2313632 [Mycena leptocephala]